VGLPYQLCTAKLAAQGSYTMLDIQSLPSLEKFDSQLLDLFKPSAAEQAVAGALDDVAAGGDPDLALQRLMSLKHLNSYRVRRSAAAAHRWCMEQQQALTGHQTLQHQGNG
jgi:hypothetical protein